MAIKPEELTDDQIRLQRSVSSGEDDDAMVAYCTMALRSRPEWWTPISDDIHRRARGFICNAINARLLQITASVSCPTCRAAPGTNCDLTAFERLGADGILRERNGDIHRSRQQAWYMQNSLKETR